MRTTLTIDDDVLFAARDQAHIRKISIGEVISELARSGAKVLQETTNDTSSLPGLGFVTLPSRGGIVSNEAVNAIREESGI